ncbi:MAG: hypothetical protein A3G59_00930 [Candidatus Taylorbacteria bacterium RIFCSPLOWO2_12_FULL_47_20]|uniref:Uncharacterized protein n=2 Tax=Candidatus Tayloriibacteriota TaxID=1817919 RepID=A0A1G2PBE7_9BACT|nr:MAG: hypothetical protein A3H68_00965 [Candidatus Taylorbacteria bacterium RIFCSPLOWO2_02_FULL_46_40]OHA45654.1 MAG: hypothetical protein A3G59_00930 [Candidatus Taylorbacteria bacterium RIFCSPLOWO2_12_FULL_47_20]
MNKNRDIWETTDGEYKDDDYKICFFEKAKPARECRRRGGLIRHMTNLAYILNNSIFPINLTRN